MSGIDITFVIGNPVEQDLVRNSFNIVVRHMHGDMNGHSSETRYYPAQEEGAVERAKRAAYVLMKLRDHAGLWGMNEERLFPIVKKYAKEIGMKGKELKQFFEDFIQPDDTDDSYEAYALIESVAVYWYDAYGQQHHVSTTFTQTL